MQENQHGTERSGSLHRFVGLGGPKDHTAYMCAAAAVQIRNAASVAFMLWKLKGPAVCARFLTFFFESHLNNGSKSCVAHAKALC